MSIINKNLDDGFVKMKNTLGTVLSEDMQNKLKALQKQSTTNKTLNKQQHAGTSKSNSFSKKSNIKSEYKSSPKDNSSPKPWFSKQELENYFERLNKSQEWLESQWPQLFNREAPKPLKRHIERDILPHVPEHLPKLQVRQAIYAYVKRRAYLESILNESWRYDLDGTAVEPISEEQKEFTRETLKTKQKKVEERHRIYEARKHYYASKKISKQTFASQDSVTNETLSTPSVYKHTPTSDRQNFDSDKTDSPKSSDDTTNSSSLMSS